MGESTGEGRPTSPPEYIRTVCISEVPVLRPLWRLMIVGHATFGGIDHYEKEWYRLVRHFGKVRITAELAGLRELVATPYK